MSTWCSKHVEAWNKFCASSWLITKINILRCTVSKTSRKRIQSGPKKCIHSLRINIFGINLNEISISGWECNIMFSQQIIILHSHLEIKISFKFILKILMSKECIHFFGPLCISHCTVLWMSNVITTVIFVTVFRLILDAVKQFIL